MCDLNKKILFNILDEWFCEKYWIFVGSKSNLDNILIC